MSGTKAERTVTARIDTAAMNKVTRFFNASTDAIIGEMLQNARRAGATEVRITTYDNQITIEDDGMGIGDPQQLLEFGASGWNDERSKAEDPAGMGFFSLARRNATVESWTEAGAGWRMELTPAHFTGEAVANVLPAPRTDCGPGTRVTFVNRAEHRTGLQNRIRETARYYPVKLSVDGQAVDHEDFLAASVYRKTVGRMRIGVERKTTLSGRHAGLESELLNFHGHVISGEGQSTGHRPPAVRSASRDYRRGPEYWIAKLDVTTAASAHEQAGGPKGHLELVLPTRNEIVENTYWNARHVAVRLEQAAGRDRTRNLRGDPRTRRGRWDKRDHEP